MTTRPEAYVGGEWVEYDGHFCQVVGVRLVLDSLLRSSKETPGSNGEVFLLLKRHSSIEGPILKSHKLEIAPASACYALKSKDLDSINVKNRKAIEKFMRFVYYNQVECYYRMEKHYVLPASTEKTEMKHSIESIVAALPQHFTAKTLQSALKKAGVPLDIYDPVPYGHNPTTPQIRLCYWSNYLHTHDSGEILFTELQVF